MPRQIAGVSISALLHSKGGVIMIDPQQALILLAVAIWIDGLWLIKLIIWKRRPKLASATTIEGKQSVKTVWEEEVH